MGRGIALLFRDHGTRRGWAVSSTPRPHFTPGKDPVPILQEAGWAPRPVWTGGKSRPNGDSIPDRPARSQSLYQLSYPAHDYTVLSPTKCTRNLKQFFVVQRCSSYMFRPLSAIFKKVIYKVILITDTDEELGDPLWYKHRTQPNDIIPLQWRW